MPEVTRKYAVSVSMFNNEVGGIPFLYEDEEPKKDEDDGDKQIKVGYVNLRDTFGTGFCDLKEIVYDTEDSKHSVDDLCEDYIKFLKYLAEEQFFLKEHNDENNKDEDNKDENNNKNTNENNDKIDENAKINYEYKDIFEKYVENNVFDILRYKNLKFSREDIISDTNTIEEDFARFGFDFTKNNEELKIILRRMEREKSELYYIAKLCQITYENKKNKDRREIIKEAIEEFKKFIVLKTKLVNKVYNDFENGFIEIYPKIIDKDDDIQNKELAKKEADERYNKLYGKYGSNKLVERKADSEANGVAATRLVIVLTNKIIQAEKDGKKGIAKEYRQLMFEVVAKQARDLNEIANVMKKVELLIAYSRQNNYAEVSSKDAKKINTIAEHTEYINNIKKNKELKKIKKIDEEIREKMNKNKLSEETKYLLSSPPFELESFINTVFFDKIKNRSGAEKMLWEKVLKNIILVTIEWGIDGKKPIKSDHVFGYYHIPEIFTEVTKDTIKRNCKIFDKIGRKIEDEITEISKSIKEFVDCIKTEEQSRIWYAQQLSHEKVKIREEGGMGDIMLGDGVIEQQQRRINEHDQLLDKRKKDFKKVIRFNELDLEIDAKRKVYIEKIREYNKKIEELSKSDKYSRDDLKKKLKLPKKTGYHKYVIETIEKMRKEQKKQEKNLKKYYTSKISGSTSLPSK